ncbi:hypothetical protein BLA50215_05611 [Burkholderia lata]|uniref:hypothetical protein n=1 Tax=Burkholderia lata (strain ATCC 17760 / DSM 23089 / LMG 22485 / NCIMB 9086 / R18194 / 383) TaxID=482957 RepID=UPI0014531E41|nr:hypothetical protein [Burkholderia lata]VWD44081.1 hypothetical protein BLA50215_05611 [Burkholderia lata]
MHKAIYALLEPWGIAQPVIAYINDLINQSFLRLVAATGQTTPLDEDDEVEPTA